MNHPSSAAPGRLTFSSARALVPAYLVCACLCGCPGPGAASQRGTTPPPPSPTRLAGDWELTSVLSVQDGAQTLQGHLLVFTRRIADLVDGNIELPGLSPFLARLAAPFVQQLAREHVPPGARELLARLGSLHEVFTETRIHAIHTLRPKGGFRYQGHSRITRVTLQTASGAISTPPDRLPSLGSIAPAPYAATETDGILRIAPHALHQSYAHLLRWALDALVATVTCQTRGLPCLKSLRDAADHLFQCGPLTKRLLALVPALGAAAPLVQAACEAQRQQILTDAETALDKIALTLTYLELSGEAHIAPDGAALNGGRWFGKLGKTYGGGEFRGVFSGRRVGP